jgi:predicted glycoside hydrolase/deacetylase ChbG (UPF0249 family)
MKLIINADDFGMTRSVNDAVIELSNLGVISSTSVMANMPFANEAADLLRYKELGIGLHVNLTEGRSILPQSEISSIVDVSGFFLPKNELIRKLKSGNLIQAQVASEIKAQYDYLSQLVGERLDHFDTHEGLDKFNYFINIITQLKSSIKQKKGIRINKKYYLKKSKDRHRIINPSPPNLFEFTPRRILVEMVFGIRAKKLSKHFSHPDGFLFSPGYNTVDLLREIINAAPKHDLLDGIYEIMCHPAASSNDLKETQMKEIRIEEYEILRSKVFIEASERLHLVNYSQI